MDIRAERDADHEAVENLHRRAFGDGHGDVVAGLVQALRHDDPDALSLVAVDDEAGDDEAGDAEAGDAAGDERVAGHILFSRSLLDAPRRLVPVQVLSPLAVAPGRQRRGIGAALIRHGLRLLDDRGVPVVFLEGDPRYYSRAGFAPGAEQGFRKPSLRIPDAGFQAITLAAHEPWMTGTLVYSATFWDHDCVGLRDAQT
jgi:putative acetyltransferase